MSNALRFSIALMGATSLLLQVLLLRELLTSFFGNELAIALVLLNWLLIVAAGSWLAGRVRRWALELGSFVTLQLLVALVAPAAIMLSRAMGGRTMFPGEVVTPPTMVALAALSVAPGCLLLGAQFAVACRIAEAVDHQRRAVSKVYALEALGAVLAGVLFHFILADYASPVAACLGLGLANSICAIWLQTAGVSAAGVTPKWLRWLSDEGQEAPAEAQRTQELRAGRLRRARIATAALLTATLLALLAIPSGRRLLNDWSLEMRWRGFDLLASVNSRFGNLAVTRSESQTSFFQDGSLLFTSEDLEASEWVAHLPMLQLARPGDILMIGPGYPATLTEVRKHPVRTVTVFEIDPALVRLAGEWLPSGARTLTTASRGASARSSQWGPTELVIGDARALLQRSAKQYDAIIVSLHDPSTAALNRYYTLEFFNLVKEHLSPEGILSLDLSGHEAYLMAERKLIHAAVYHALARTFADVWVAPGFDVHLLAARQPGVLTRDPELLARRLEERGIRAQFVSPFSLGIQLIPFKAELYVDAIRKVTPVLNTDLQPVTYSNYLRLWLRQYAAGGLRVLSVIERAPRGSHWLLLIAVALAAAARHRRFEARRQRIALYTAAVGFVEMGLQLVVILGFQALVGCLYYEIGILIALNMAGLALGGWAGGLPWMTVRQGGALLLLALGVSCLAYSFGAVLGALQGALWAVPACLGAVALVTGVLGGAAFPLAVSQFHPIGGDQARSGSMLYAWDLIGGAAAAMIVGLFLIPSLGLSLASAVVGNIGLVGLLLLAPVCARGR